VHVRLERVIKLEENPYLVQHVQQTFRLLLVVVELTDVRCDLFLQCQVLVL